MSIALETVITVLVATKLVCLSLHAIVRQRLYLEEEFLQLDPPILKTRKHFFTSVIAPLLWLAVITKLTHTIN